MLETVFLYRAMFNSITSPFGCPWWRSCTWACCCRRLFQDLPFYRSNRFSSNFTKVKKITVFYENWHSNKNWLLRRKKHLHNLHWTKWNDRCTGANRRHVCFSQSLVCARFFTSAVQIRAEKGWAMKRACPSKKVWCSGLGSNWVLNQNSKFKDPNSKS